MSPLRTVLVAFVALLLTGPAAAYVYWTPETLLPSFFPAPVAVEAVSFTPDPAALEAALGYPLPRPTYTIQVGRSGDTIVGYAVLDQQVGQHEPIDFGVLLYPAGNVQRVEILVYREPYGDGVRGAAFRNQFRGLGPSAPMRPGRDIRVVSGATISTRSISIGVRRACVLVAAYLGRG
jgi:electron transport complex protein RnfG